MANYGFYYDAENCIGCRTCQVACKDAHDLPVGTFYRKVTSYVTGEGWTPSMYHISLPLEGCDFCAKILGGGEQPACVASCLQRVLEFGDVDELRAKHAGENFDEAIAALDDGRPAGPEVLIRAKKSMANPNFEEIII